MQTVSEDISLDKLEEMLKKYPERDESLLIPVFQEAQEIYGYLPKAVLERIAEHANVAINRALGVVSFYAQFRLSPQGRNTIRVCRGTACHVRGGKSVLRAVERILAIQEGETTDDLKFSLETVACFGTCFLAPVMMVNNSYFGKLAPEKVETILEQYE